MEFNKNLKKIKKTQKHKNYSFYNGNFIMDNDIYTWGWGKYGQLGHGDELNLVFIILLI